MMCPDHQILSIYLDGELPSPWKEKLGHHLEGCSKCRDRLEAYRNLVRGTAENAAADAAMEAAKKRVWLKLQGRGEEPFLRRAGIWRKSISVPLPLAAAAAAVLFIALGALVFRQFLPAADGAMAAGMDLEVRGMMPVSDMSGVLQYLGTQDTGDIVILQLPESRSFMSSGEPRIIRAAEMPARASRGVPARLPSGSGAPQ